MIITMAHGFIPKRGANRNVAEPTGNWFAGAIAERDHAALLRLGKKPVLKVRRIASPMMTYLSANNAIEKVRLHLYPRIHM